MTPILASTPDGWREIFSLRVSGWALQVQIGILVLILLAVFILFLALRHRSRPWALTQADFTFAGCASFTVCPTDDVAGLAHQAWVEIKTRKAALPFDDQYDVVVEIYNSWYELFRAIRELAKAVHTKGTLEEGSETAKLIQVLMDLLNVGLRPHLTRWQAAFRRWYEAECAKPEWVGVSPQEIQRRYPEYDAMVSDIKEVNQGLQASAASLSKIAHERQRAPWWKFWASPHSDRSVP